MECCRHGCVSMATWKMADSSDVLMCLMFDFINKICYNDGKYLSLSPLPSLSSFRSVFS